MELYKLVKATESKLHLFIRVRLQATLGEDESGWWLKGVPEKIRLDCVQRWEKYLRREQAYNYTYLIDLKDILDKNWKFFEMYIRQLKGQSKKQFLADLARLNDIRNVAAHAVRGEPPQEDVDFACYMRDIIEQFCGPG